MRAERRFLTAEWRDLLMLNYEVDSALLQPRVPVGCELDSWNGRTHLSVVGFMFLRTRLLGVPVPFHRNFEEVNLRFYVGREVDGEWRRGVVFIKEIVPRRALAWVARRAYGENYIALPMRHTGRVHDPGGEARVGYEWRRDGRWEGLSARIAGEPALAPVDSEETFISEHYWGYTAQADGRTIEYQVEHPRWQVWRATDEQLDCDAATLYAPELAGALTGEPTSAFVADGSAVVVRRGRRLE